MYVQQGFECCFTGHNRKSPNLANVIPQTRNTGQITFSSNRINPSCQTPNYAAAARHPIATRTRHAALITLRNGKQIASIHYAGVEFSSQVIHTSVEATKARRHVLPTRRIEDRRLMGAKKTSKSKPGNF